MTQHSFLDFKAADKPPQISGFFFNPFLQKYAMNKRIASWGPMYLMWTPNCKTSKTFLWVLSPFFWLILILQVRLMSCDSLPLVQSVYCCWLAFPVQGEMRECDKPRMLWGLAMWCQEMDQLKHYTSRKHRKQPRQWFQNILENMVTCWKSL